MQTNIGVSRGLMEDVIDLKHKYDILGGRTYKAFVDAWHEEKMPFIKCGLQSLAETLEFTEETYNVAKVYLNPPSTYRERVFGMYLLNAFYNCQHLKDEVKVLMTLQEWKDLLKLKDEFLANGDDKAAFLFCLMRASNAFVASASARNYGLNKNYRRYFNLLIDQYKYSSYSYRHSQEVIESDLVSDIEKLCAEATAMREKIRNPCSPAVLEELPDIKRGFLNVIYETKLSDVARSIQKFDQHAESSECEVSKDIGTRRQQLKKKSFVAKNLSPRHARDVKSSARNCTSSSSDEDEPQAGGNSSDSDYSPTKKCVKRKSRRRLTK